jgi:hypothetical protein
VKDTFDTTGASAAGACPLATNGAAVTATETAPTFNKSRRVISKSLGPCIAEFSSSHERSLFKKLQLHLFHEPGTHLMCASLSVRN